MGLFKKAAKGLGSLFAGSAAYAKLGMEVTGTSTLDYMRMSTKDRIAVSLAGKAEADRRAAEAARYRTPSRPDGYYSQMRADGKIDQFISKDGEITSERPHVHIVHSEPEGRIIFTVTQADGSHTNQATLPFSASGSEVNAMVNRLRRELH